MKDATDSSEAKLGHQTRELMQLNEQLRNEIEDRKKLTAEALKRQKYLESVLYNAPDAIVTLDAEHRVLEWNPGAERIFGYTRAEAAGRNLDDLVSRDDAYGEATRITSQVLAGSVLPPLETVRYRKDGTPVEVIAAGSPITIGGQVQGVVAVYTDISELKATYREKERLEGRLNRFRKMEAIGTLAGGIAHDFNNLMTGIQGCTSLMLLEVDETHPFHKHLKTIEAQVISAVGLTRQLLGYAREGKYETVSADLNALVRRTVDLFGRTRKEIRIVTGLQPNLWPVEMDRGQIEQVMLNLYVNAWQAMPDGGTLTVTTANCPGAMMAAVLGGGDIRHARVTVSDTGIGMDAKTKGRIFDPFFTTKDKNRGTGLGLASAYAIIKKHGGFIDVDSEPGRGSAFSIYLPATDKPAEHHASRRAELVKGTGTILLVDDESFIVDVGRQMLQKLGYVALTAGSGREALRVYAEKGAGIDAVILDIIMPEMGGGEVFEQLKAMDPDVCVLLSSGYSLEGEAAEILARGCRGFIQKPFDIQHLAEQLGNVLAAGRS